VEPVKFKVDTVGRAELISNFFRTTITITGSIFP